MKAILLRVLLIGSLILSFSAFAHPLPPGNYLGTCDSCFMHGHTLDCVCKDNNGFPNSTSLNVHRSVCPYVRNVNGELRCNAINRGAQLYGDFQNSCRACFIERGTLKCQCPDANGVIYGTILPNARQCSFIQNASGRLQCRDNYTHPQTHDVEAGPLWNQHHAEHACPTVCGRQGAHWNGQWHTTVEGQMSVCSCDFS